MIDLRACTASLKAIRFELEPKCCLLLDLACTAALQRVQLALKLIAKQRVLFADTLLAITAAPLYHK